MTESPTEIELRELALRTLLSSHPEAVLAALGPDGFRVPMPASLGLSASQILPLPADRTSVVDLVIPADAMTLLATFERAFSAGMAMATVRMRNQPDRFLTISFVDMRPQHGVWLSVVTDPDTAHSQNDTATLSESLAIPVRPRTATMRKNWRGIVSGIDERVTRMLGWSPQQMIDVRSLEFMHPDDQERAVASWMALLASRQSERVRLRHRCQDDSWLWVEVEHTFHDAEDLEDAVVVAQISDISDEMAAHAAVDRREALFRRLAESLPVGLLQLECNGLITYTNARLGQILGVRQAASLDEHFGTIVDEDRMILDAALAEALHTSRDQELEVSVRLPITQELRRCAVTLIALGDEEGAPGALVCVNDITDGARMRDELKAKATFDVLTGCHNRASVLAYLDAILTTETMTPTAVIFIDLDRFKPINDTHGHAAGDELLVHVARQLTELVRGGDLVGRIGGDEFLLICPGLSALAEALAIAERVREALHRTVELTACTVDVGASIGVAYADAAISADQLIAQADAAMYQSKRHGHGRPLLYEPHRDDTVRAGGARNGSG